MTPMLVMSVVLSVGSNPIIVDRNCAFASAAVVPTFRFERAMACWSVDAPEVPAVKVRPSKIKVAALDKAVVMVYEDVASLPSVFVTVGIAP